MDDKIIAITTIRTLSIEEISQICGDLSWGTAIFALVTGFVTGGPIGLGLAASGLVGAKRAIRSNVGRHPFHWVFSPYSFDYL